MAIISRDGVELLAVCGRQAHSREGRNRKQEQVRLPRHPEVGQVRQGAAAHSRESPLHDVCGGELEATALPNRYLLDYKYSIIFDYNDIDTGY